MGGQYGRKGQDADSTAQLPLPSAMYSMLGTWPDQVQDSGQSLHFPCWKLQLAYVQVCLPGSDLVLNTHLLWV